MSKENFAARFPLIHLLLKVGRGTWLFLPKFVSKQCLKSAQEPSCTSQVSKNVISLAQGVFHPFDVSLNVFWKLNTWIFANLYFLQYLEYQILEYLAIFTSPCIGNIIYSNICPGASASLRRSRRWAWSNRMFFPDWQKKLKK